MAVSVRGYLRAIFGGGGLGVPATFTPSGGDPVTLRALDVTKGVDVSKPGDLPSVTPVARVRMSELAAKGIDRSELRGGTLAMNGATWKVTNHRPKPLFAGEAEGLVELVLRAS